MGCGFEVGWVRHTVAAPRIGIWDSMMGREVAGMLAALEMPH